MKIFPLIFSREGSRSEHLVFTVFSSVSVEVPLTFPPVSLRRIYSLLFFGVLYMFFFLFHGEF